MDKKNHLRKKPAAKIIRATRALANKSIRGKKPRQKSVPQELIVQRPSGNALHYLTTNQLGQLEAMAAIGLRIVEVARILGFSTATFYRIRSECPELNEIWERGRNLGKRSLLKIANEKARNGDNEMIKFILSRIHGLHETQINEVRRGFDVYEGMTENELQARVDEIETRIKCAKNRPKLKLLLPPEAPLAKIKKS